MSQQLLLISCLFALFNALTVTAQSYIGIQTGINFTNLAADQDSLDVVWYYENGEVSRPMLRGYQLGMPIEIGLSRMIALQPELNIIEKGFRRHYEGPVRILDYGGDLTQRYKGLYMMVLTYVEVPLLLKLRFGSKFVQAHLEAGPSIGIVYNGHIFRGIKVGDNSYKVKEKESLERYFYPVNLLDYGLNVGGGINLAAGRSKLSFNVRYQHGLQDISDLDSFEAFNRGLAGSLTYFFPLGAAVEEPLTISE